MEAEYILKNLKKAIDKADIELAEHLCEKRVLNDGLALINGAKELLTKVLFIKKHESKVLEDIVNAGLEYAYPEKTLNFRIEFVEKYGKVTAEFYLNDLVLKNPFIGDGGGIISMVGLLLYVTFIKITGKKIVLLDEVEAMVDIEASKKLFAFLHNFAKENDIIVMCITHKNLPYMEKTITNNIKVLKLEEE